MLEIDCSPNYFYYLSDIVFVLSGRQRGVYGGYPGGILREGNPGLT
jgi:hypothetical protein